MNKKPQENNIIMQYFSFAWQLIAGLILAVYTGNFADKGLKTSMPLLVWILPLLVIVAMMIKVIRDTTNRKNDKV